jgi:hypothetical protein
VPIEEQEEHVPLGEPAPEPAGDEEEQKLEIEVIDDTPEPDRGKTPPKEPVEKIAGDESGDERYPEDVRKRIKSLRYVFHEERRGKEKAERETQEAIGYAQRILDENNRLKAQLSTGERVLIDQAQRRALAQVEQAKELYRQAHESGDTDRIVKAQEGFSRAVAEHDRLQQYQPSTPPPGTQPPPPQQAPVPQQAQPQQQEIDDRTKGWLKKNPWFGTPGYEEMTSLAMGVHTRLSNRGVLPTGETADEYWTTVESRLQQVFPEQFGSGSGNPSAAGQAQNGAAAPENGRTNGNRPRPVVVSAGSRSPNGPIKVRLTQTQVEIARRLGLTREQYARELVKEQKNS